MKRRFAGIHCTVFPAVSSESGRPPCLVKGRRMAGSAADIRFAACAGHHRRRAWQPCLAQSSRDGCHRGVGLRLHRDFRGFGGVRRVGGGGFQHGLGIGHGIDHVTIDFAGSVDGEEFEGGKASDFVLAMGQGRMIPGFEDGIKGHKAGEEFTIDVTFPEEYHAENLKGKAAKFAINLKKVEERELPELTEEFIKRFGVEDGSVEGLRAEVRKNMERELKSAIRNRVKSQAIEGLVKANDIDVPAALIDSEIDVLRRQAAQRFGGNEKQALELPRELFEEQAKRRVVVGLLLGEVIRTNELKADEERVKGLIEEMASAYEDPKEVIEFYSKNKELMDNMRNVALEEQAVEAVLAKAKVTEKETTFNELMNQQA